MNQKALRSAFRFMHRTLGKVPGIGNRYCEVCKSSVIGFRRYRGGTKGQPPLMSALQIVGSDLDNFSCPVCGSHDRERHLLMYMERLGVLERLSGACILHFAPEQHIARAIRARAPIQYIQADLVPSNPGIERFDISAIPFESGCLDYVIANHVLEHVCSVADALSEIRRVLKDDGFAILQAPYSARLNATWEDSGIDDDSSRLQAYGQEDHVRLFGRDIFDHIVESGFVSHVGTHAEILPDKDARYLGVNDQEPFFLFRKSGQNPD